MPHTHTFTHTSTLTHTHTHNTRTHSHATHTHTHTPLSLCLTKLDCLDTFPAINVCVGYKLHGDPLTSFPADLHVLAHVEVEYITLPGWRTDITHTRRYNDLPPNAKAYVAKVTELIGVPVQWVGVGPARDATLTVE